jgi:HEAT repeats
MAISGRLVVGTLSLLAGSTGAGFAQTGELVGVVNARMERRPAAPSLDAAFRNVLADSPSWIGYSVPAIRAVRNCCWNGSDDGNCGQCRLEKDSSFTSSSSGRPGVVSLEGTARLRVLFRASGRKVERIRTFSEDCVLDVGGLPLVWLDDVPPADSLRLLASFVGGQSDRDEGSHLTEGALAAIAFHQDEGADVLLDRFTAPERPEHLRKKAAFWMGNARGRHGFETLRRLVKDDKSASFRKDVTFALTQSREPEADQVLIETARQDGSGEVRSQALFWLAQKAGRKASAVIARAIEEDPETDVKKKAVFALSQLPKDEGVPLLIRTARENRNPAVRKQAMFWLGQSGDPRALAFFEEVLRSPAR